MNPRVTDVQPRDNYTLNVAFETGELRRFDATPYLDRGVFRRLRKRPLFKAARVVAGSVAWPGEIDLSYDTVYLASNANLFGVTFDPWVGSEYWSNNRFGVRILVLGESHYGTANNVCTTFTSDLVREWTKNGTGRFFPSCPGFFRGSTRVAALMPRDGPRFGNTWRSTTTFRNSLATTNASHPTMKCGNQRRSPFVASSMN